jgi:hypothetical protein
MLLMPCVSRAGHRKPGREAPKLQNCTSSKKQITTVVFLHLPTLSLERQAAAEGVIITHKLLDYQRLSDAA